MTILSYHFNISTEEILFFSKWRNFNIYFWYHTPFLSWVSNIYLVILWPNTSQVLIKMISAEIKSLDNNFIISLIQYINWGKSNFFPKWRNFNIYFWVLFICDICYTIEMPKNTLSLLPLLQNLAYIPSWIQAWLNQHNNNLIRVDLTRLNYN